jgi:hypothetical protein
MYHISKKLSILFISIALLGYADMAIGQMLFSYTMPDSVANKDRVRYMNKIKLLNNINGEYISITNAEPRLAHYRIYKIDSVGRVIKSRLAQTYYLDQSNALCPGNFIIEKGKIYVPAYSRNPKNTIDNCIMVYDDDLNVIDSINLFQYISVNDTSSNGNTLIRYSESEMIYDIAFVENHIYLTGFVQRFRDSINMDGTNKQLFFYNSTCLVYKLDRDFNVIWKKEYGDTSISKINMGQKLLFLQDGTITVVNQIRRFRPLNHRFEFISNRSKVNFIKIDTAGHVLSESTWPKEPNRWYFRNVSNACEVSPHNEIVIGGYYSDSSFSNLDGEGKILLAKFDSNLNLMWEYIGGNPYIVNAINKVHIDSAGNILVAGQHDQQHTPMFWQDSVISSGFIAWFSRDGSIKKWYNVYPIKEVTITPTYIGDEKLNIYAIYDIYPEANGTFTGCGTILSRTLKIQSPWFFRIDSNGCLTPECDTSFYKPPVIPKDTLPKDTIIGSVQELYKLYASINTNPNPATIQVHIESPIKIENYTLTSTSGKIIQSDAMEASNSIDISRLPSGLYFLQLHLANGQTVMKKVVKE